MDLTACTMTTHGLIPASLQPAPAPGLNGRTAILCPAKTSPWETIVTHLPHHPPPPCILSSPPPPLPPPEIPKESIIANTDFTTTSVIAKRRLSSKKRRQQQQQQSQGLSSPNKDAHTTLSDDATSRSATTTTTNSSPSSSAQSSTTLTHPIAGSIGGVGPSHVMAVPAPQYVHVPVAASMSLPHNDQVLSQLQLPHQYQLVQQQDTTQKQVLYCKNIKEESTVRQQESHCQPSSNQPTTSKDFKWSNAHVFIAKRIQDHQKQLQLQEQQKLHQQRIEQQQKLHQQRMEQQVIQQQQQQLQHQQTQLQLRQLQQQQQQQYALLHVYGCLPNAHPPHAPGTASVISLADIHQQHPQQVCVSGLPLVQPASSQVLGLLPQGVGLHAGGIPLAVAQPADLQTYVASQGMGGSWVGPTVPIVGSCVVNPLQPAATGLLATTSWVK